VPSGCRHHQRNQAFDGAAFAGALFAAGPRGGQHAFKAEDAETAQRVGKSASATFVTLQTAWN